MSIASRITAITGHITDIYDTLELGGDTTENKNIVNINTEIKREYKNFLANGTDTLWNNWEKVSGSGETLTLNNTMEGKMKVDLKGNTQQNGTPNPDYPQDIQVVSGDNTIKVEGKNLFDKSREVNSTFTNSIATALSNYKSTGEYATGYFDLGTRISSNVDFITSFTPCQSGTTYTIKNTYSVNANLSMVGFIDENGNVINHNSSWSSNAYTHTATSEEKYIICGIKINDNGRDYRDYVQIEIGSLLTQYTPYVSQTYPISLGNIELCKIGTYQDSIVKDNGKWYLNKQIGKVVLDGSEEYTYQNNARFYLWLSTFTNDTMPKNSSTPAQLEGMYCNYFKEKTRSETWAGTLGISYDNPTGTGSSIDIACNSIATTVEAFKTWLSTHNVEIYYLLQNPHSIEITDTTLLSQLEALAYSYDGTTNISQVNDDLPFVLDITALKEIS